MANISGPKSDWVKAALEAPSEQDWLSVVEVNIAGIILKEFIFVENGIVV